MGRVCEGISNEFYFLSLLLGDGVEGMIVLTTRLTTWSTEERETRWLISWHSISIMRTLFH